MHDDLEQRVRSLEAALRRQRWAAGVGIVVLLLALAVRTSEAKPEKAPTLRAERVEIVTAEGEARGTFGLDANGRAELKVRGGKDEGSAELNFTKEGRPGLAVRNAAGKAQLIAMLGEGGPVFLFTDAEGSIVSSLSFRQENGTTLFGMRLPGEKEHRAVLTVMKNGEPYLRLRGPEGDLRVLAKPEFEFQEVEPK